MARLINKEREKERETCCYTRKLNSSFSHSCACDSSSFKKLHTRVKEKEIADLQTSFQRKSQDGAGKEVLTVELKRALVPFTVDRHAS